MSEIQQARYDKLLRRVADLKGPGSKVSDALGDLFPTFDVETNKGELQVLAAVRLCMASFTLSASAPNTSRIQLFNPANSGIIATVTTASVGNEASAFVVNITTTGTAFVTTPGLERFRDTRLGLLTTPTCFIATNQTVAPTTPTLSYSLLADTMIPLVDENDFMILGPGTGIEVGTAVINRSLIASFLWRERTAEPSELNF